MKRFLWSILTAALIFITAAAPTVFAQSAQPNSSSDLAIYTQYPSQVIGIGESVSISMVLKTETTPQVADVEIQGLPEGWTASFRGNGRIVNSAYVEPGTNSNLDLRVDPAADVKAGIYTMTVIAKGTTNASEQITLTVQEKAPASLEFQTDLPTLRGRPSTTFRYTATLKNEGDEDLMVNLVDQTPSVFGVTFTSSGQEVSSLPVEANSSKQISIEVAPNTSQVPAGTYPIVITAEGGQASTQLNLTAEVVGESELSLTTPDGLLSGDAKAGGETSFDLDVKNIGSAVATGITVSASAPTGWKVVLSPETINSLNPGDNVKVTAKVTPGDKAIAGDYMINYQVKPEEGTSQSIDYRVTVRTSTLWGLVGIILIAVAVAVVGISVSRFGRR